MTFCHIHTHSEFSALDGLSTCEEIAFRAAADGNPAAVLTDHGICAGHPEHQRACDRHGVKPVFGMEGYFIADRLRRPAAGDKEAQKQLRAYRHLILIARGQQGLRDLWAMSTEAYASGFYHRPRIDWPLLEQYGSDLIVTTACLGGIISKPLLSGDYQGAAGVLDRLRAIFPGRLYLEIQPIALPLQAQLNKLLVEIAGYTGLPLVAAADSHYPSEDMAQLHKTWLACQTSPANDDYWTFDHMLTEAGVRSALGYLGSHAVDEAVRNTVLITEQCDARIGASISPPVFGAAAEEDARSLYARCQQELGSRIRSGILRGGTLRDYRDRLDGEYRLVRDKQLSGCYLMVDDICRWVRSRGILIGPGRGSAAGSLMSYLLGITITDPLETGLMFGRFLTPGRTALPDFDLDFPSSQRAPIQNYVIGKYGPEHVVRVGTHMYFRNKSILDKLFGLHSRDLPADYFTEAREISAIIDEAESHTAGLGLPWPELMDQCADPLAPYIERYQVIFRTAGQLVGRLKAYGQHPAGLVISTGAPLEGMLPMRTPKPNDPSLVSQWDFRDMEAQGLLKLDFLTLRTLDSIQEAITLIERRTGTRPDPSSWRDEYRDPQVWDEISSGFTAGMFQVETSLGQRSCRRMEPRSLAELADLITLVRPGPRNSGMAESYLRRRAGREEVVYPHDLLRETLEQRFGVMLYQEDILRTCTLLAGYDGAEADEVRKVLGKKLTDKIEAAGRKFTSRCEANGIERDAAEALWSSMAEFGRYAFNLAHAYSYAMLAYWTAWLKSHYPAETLAAICSTLDDKERIPRYVTEARRLGLTVLPPDINRHSTGFAVEGISLRYGLDAISGVGPQALAAIERGRPYASYQGVERAQLNAGLLYALASAGALDSLVPSRRSLVERLDAERAGDTVRCVHKDERAQGPNGLPCLFDWAAEPPLRRVSDRTGRELKPLVRLPPKKCTRACRHYTQPEAIAMSAAVRYDPAELWRAEHGIFGTWLTPVLFEQLDEVTPGARQLLREISGAWHVLPPGSYLLPGVIAGRREALTRTGSKMIWLTLASESSYIDIAVFSPREDGDPDLVRALNVLPEGTLVLATAEKSRYRARDGAVRMSARLRAIRRM